jgi:hypothetical protein
VLFNSETGLAITLPEGDADRGYIAGITFAHIFSAADRRQPAKVPGLDRLYSDGAGRKFILTDIGTAKGIALNQLDAVIASLSTMEG